MVNRRAAHVVVGSGPHGDEVVGDIQVEPATERIDPREAGAYETANRLDLSWRGLARYWRKRGA